MYYQIKDFVTNSIKRFINLAAQNKIHGYNVDKNILDNIHVVLEYPKDKNHGHFATTVSFTLAKYLKKNPKVIANDLVEFIKNENNFFENMESINGYINFKLSDSFINNQIDKALQDKANFARGRTKNYKILLEYVSANPTGPLHIGHARGAIFGNVLQKVGNRLGYEITSEYYVNDAGSQISMLSLSVYNQAMKMLGLKEIDGEVYRGDYIVDVANKAINRFQKSFFTDKNFNEIQEELGVFAKDLMLDEIKNNLKEANIVFDSFVSEKEIYKQWEETLRELKENDAIEERSGAIWLKASLKGDEKDRVLVRENGEPTYMAGDIIYHKNKFLRHYNSYIDIWGADHHGYINRIKASLEFLNFDSNKLEVLLTQMVSILKGGQPYKMSKRAGNFILMKDIISEIGADNLRFIFLSKSPDTHLEFDLENLKNEDSSNPVFYINYANARIHTLISKSNFNEKQILDSNLCDLENEPNSTLKQDLIQLNFQALNLFHVLNQSYEDRAPQKLCDYLKTLAKQFHSFYNEYRILNNKYEAIILKSFLMVSLSFEVGFEILGIQIKTKM